MAPTTTKTKAALSDPFSTANSKMTSSKYGAPSQLTQGSRKGKRAWRKNVDIAEVEEGLEKLRDDERVTGGPVHEKSDKDLFMVDVTGDEKTRKRIGKPLKSLAILKERSAVPAVFSRPERSDDAKARIGREARDRLRRKAGKDWLHPHRVADLTEAVKSSGSYDVWSEKEDAVVGLSEEGKEFVLPYVVKAGVKPPRTSHFHDSIALPSIPTPHPGQSYNPAADAHEKLLLEAYKLESAKTAELERLQVMKEKLDELKALRAEVVPGVASGMQLDNGEVESEEAGATGDGDIVVVKSQMPKRKTRQQRAKAERALAEKRAAVHRRAQTRILASIHSIPSIKRALAASTSLSQQRTLQRKLRAAEKLQAGLAGWRIGKHRVPEARVDLQLGEELSETLREMKPEGNLFRERWVSMMQRAMVEPRVPVAPKKNRNVKMWESHYYKRFV